MRFGFLSEGDTPIGSTHYQRYHELVDQVIAAERAGWDIFGCSEQHLAIGGASTSSPEVLYSYMMARTSRIKFSFAVALMAGKINHPIRTAERISTLDILSHGRMEAVFGRGNTMLALRAFEVDSETNKAEMEEGIDLVLAAFNNDPFNFVGEFYKVPPRSLIPKPFTTPHPPLGIAATSVASATTAGQKGLGLVSFANFSGFDALNSGLNAYDEAWAASNHGPEKRKFKSVLISGLVCEETLDQARTNFLPLLDYIKLAVGAYDRLADTSADYSYTKTIKQHVDSHIEDADYMMDDSASFVVGDPEACIKQIRKFEELGVQELWLRLDSMPHQKIVETLERFGRYVIPHFKNPKSVVKDPDVVLQSIRERRAGHAAELESFLAKKNSK
jgi:alkanesulfonate monooxygenase SsuD/methylene tetrahydromethanopterin reductase-like flavin-dependent oxidoreductase (luciferase family)